MIPGVFILADARGQVADFLGALLLVYTLIIFVYIITSLIFSFGGKVPYSRWSDAILGFLRDVCEPYLGLFRRFIPPIGPLDISPIVAILVLQIVGGILVGLVRG
ncbi:MAG: YggT family protein [Solirubrobacteraceae bacterium]|nr:YggT family protein [Solirubrobacteraceae bacterium]